MYQTVLCVESRNIKPEHKIVETLGFVDILSIPNFPEDVIRIVLSKVHGEFFWLDSIHKITKEAVRVVTGLPSTGSRLDRTKKVSNDTVMDLTGTTFDKRSLRVNDVKDINVRFVSMILGYKATHANRLNSVSSLCIKSAYDLVNNNAKIDICEWLKDELIDNLKKIKGDKKGTFRFRNFLVCLMLYITKEVPGIGRKDFGFDIPVGKQLLDTLNNMRENIEKNINEHFQALKERMKTRIRLSQAIVDKYQKEICFVIKKYEIGMEVVVPRTIWVTEMGYETNDNIIETYAKSLLEASKEPSKKFFGNGEIIESGIQSQKRVKKDEQTVRKDTRQAKSIKEDVLKQAGIKESELEGLQLKTHLSLIATSSDSEIPTVFKRVERKRKSSPTPRRTGQKQ